MRKAWKRVLSLTAAGGVLAALLPVTALGAGRLDVSGGGELPLGAERTLEVDVGKSSLNGRRTVTLSGYMDILPEDYVSDGLTLRLDGLEEETWSGLDQISCEDGALLLDGAAELPEAAAAALSGGAYTVEYFVDSEGYSGGGQAPAPLLTSGGWRLQTKKAGETLGLTPGNGAKTVTAPFETALGGPCAVAAQHGGRESAGGWYRDGRMLSAFQPGTKPDGNSLILGGEDTQARLYSLRIYDRALTGAELRANAALDRDRFLGAGAPVPPPLTVGGRALDKDGTTELTLEFEKGVAGLPVVSGAEGDLTLTVEAEGKSVRVSLHTYSALDAALKACPRRTEVTVAPKATALEVRTAIAKRVEAAIRESGFTEAGGKVRVIGDEKNGFTLKLTGEGRTESVALKASVYRREAKNETLEQQLARVQKGYFDFSRAEDVTAEAIAAQAAGMVEGEKTGTAARWDEHAGCWMLKLERGGQEAEAPLYLNSEADLRFDGPALLDSAQVRAALNDDVYVAGGTLNVEGTAGNNYEAVVLPVWNYGRNFCIDAEVRMTGAVGDARWCGLAFGVRPGSTGKAGQFAFWQMALRWDASAENGVECAQMLPGGAWNPRAAAALDERVDPERVYRLTVRYEDGVVCQYVDGALVLRAEAPDAASANGKLAFTFDGAAAELLSLRVTGKLPDLPTEQTLAANGYDAKLYEPKTGLVMSPTIVSEERTGAAAAAEAERRPATLVKTLRSDLTVEDGGVPISIAEFLKRLDRRVLMGLRIEDAATAAAFAQYAAAAGLVDVNVFSSGVSTLQTACGGRAGVRGVLDLSDAMPSRPVDAVSEANRAGARVVVLPAGTDRETVRYLQARAVAVWVRPAADGLYEAILSGADGLVVDDPAAALDAVESFRPGERVLTRTPVVTAHRGLHQNAPENTVRSAQLAVAAGADAIECDVHLSADGVVMVSHDGTTGGLMDRDLYIVLSTRAQLQALAFRWDGRPEDRMPTLAELFQAAAGTDAVFLVEIKSPDPRLIDPLAQTIRAAGMEDRVVFLSYDQKQLQRIRGAMPEVSAGTLSAYTRSGADAAANLKSLADVLDPLNAFYSCPQEAQTPALVRALRHRGVLVHPWTVDEYELFEQKVYDGYHGFTTDRADFATYYLAGAEAEQRRAAAAAGADGAMVLRVRQLFREGSAVVPAAGFLQVGGDVEVRQDGEGRFWADRPGAATVLLRTDYTLPATQVPYSMYTQPVELAFTSPSA